MSLQIDIFDVTEIGFFRLVPGSSTTAPERTIYFHDDTRTDQRMFARANNREALLAEEMPEEALVAFANAQVPSEYAHLDELMDDD